MDDSDDRGYSRAPQLSDVVALCRALNREGARYILIGGFAVVLHGLLRATRNVDLLVEASPENLAALRRAMADLPDNAIAFVEDGDLEQYQVVRVADEFVVDLLVRACGIDYAKALVVGVETKTVEGVDVTVASKPLLILTKETPRESDAGDVRYLRWRIEEEGGGKWS